MVTQRIHLMIIDQHHRGLMEGADHAAEPSTHCQQTAFVRIR